MPRLHFEIDVPSSVLPENLKEQFVSEVRTTAVLNLVGKHAISQGRAAELLRISRAELFDLMSEAGVPHIDLTSDELAAESDVIRQDLQNRTVV